MNLLSRNSHMPVLTTGGLGSGGHTGMVGGNYYLQLHIIVKENILPNLLKSHCLLKYPGYFINLVYCYPINK